MWALRAVPKAIGAELLVAGEPFMEAVSTDPVVATGFCDAATDLFGMPDDRQAPSPSFG
jgi:hypothetical protein